MSKTVRLFSFGLLAISLICFPTCRPQALTEVTESVDLAIEDALILTMDSTWQQYENGTVLIRDGQIIAVGPTEQLAGTYQAKKAISASGQVLLPGLINTHTHLAMTLFRGLADDLPLQTWLAEHIWPAEGAIMDADAVYAGSRLAIAELIRSGTTCFNDMYFFADEVARAAAEAGMRGRVGEGILNFPTPRSQNPAEAFAFTQQLLKKYQDHPLIGVCVTPHSAYACGPELLQQAARLATEYGVPLHIHLAETLTEGKTIQEIASLSPTAYLESLGVLQAGFIGAHGVHVSESDQQLLQQHQMGIAHCPESNMKLASGIAPVPQMQEKGIVVGLGTDGAASNNDLDLFEEMSTTAKLHKVHLMDPTVLPAKEVLAMATIEGAKLLGWEDRIGSIETGKAADLILVDLQGLHLQPLYRIYSHLVYSADGQDVSTVVVNGKILMQDRQLLTLDEEQIKSDAMQYRDQILASFPPENN